MSRTLGAILPPYPYTIVNYPDLRVWDTFGAFWDSLRVKPPVGLARDL